MNKRGRNKMLGQHREPNVIRYMRGRSRAQMVREKDAYEFKPVGRFQFAQRWLWAALRWTGAIRDHLTEEEVITYSDLRSQKMCDAVLEAMRDSHRHGRDPGQIIMGRDEFMEINKSPDVYGVLQFNVGPFHERDGDGSVRMFDVPVKVVPWIKGWAII